ncbi:MAG: transposase [Rhodobacteraceae bacterium]|nr:transposase [Paracoccaceae bacterium]
MSSLPVEMIEVLTPFMQLFSASVWPQALVLISGALLAPGPRTVSRCLRVMGLAGENHFTNYHRVLNRAQWSSLQAGKILLGLLVRAFVPPGAVIVLGADDTVERRWGRKIKAKGCYRDAVRSSKKHVVKCFGLKWVAMMLLVPVPWAQRVWALPFLTVLCWPPAKAGKRQHKTSVDGVRQMVEQVRRWLPDRVLVLVVDGGFAAVALAVACTTSEVAMISRMRLDAALYHPPGPQPAGKRGRKPTKGPRQRSLKVWAARTDTPWESVVVTWYRGERKALQVFSRTALWYTSGWAPVAIRFVLVRDPDGRLSDAAFFCTDLQATPTQIIEWVVMRWSVEVTFEEARAHLGLETQRQWSDQAIARTTPVLLGLFSLVTLLALRLCPTGHLPIETAAWYQKSTATFADCLTVVRRYLWRARYLNKSAFHADLVQLPREAFECLLDDLPLAA